MTKIKKTKSGKWHTYVFDYTDENGKNHSKSITADTKAEVEYLAAQFKKSKREGTKIARKMTVYGAVDKYINSMRDELSPTTISGYEVILANAFPALMQMNIEDLTDDVINAEIRKESKRINSRTGKTLSAKTVKNEYRLISSALKHVCKLSFTVKLPSQTRTNKVLPEPEDIIKLVKGTDIELPCLLAMWLSFTISEIMGLTCSSIKGDAICIDKVRVYVHNAPVLKDKAKTETRIRVQRLPKYIKELIEETDVYKEYLKTGKDDFLIQYNRDYLRNRYTKLVRSVYPISFHDLRHVFATVMLSKLSIAPKLVQLEGGWKSDYVLNQVYSNSFGSIRNEADDLRDEFYNKIIEIH